MEATFSRRRRVLVVIALCVWGAVWVRAIQLQIIKRTTLVDISDQQSDRKVQLIAARGEIVDCKERLLAITVGSESFFAYPNREISAWSLAAKFAPLRGGRVSRLAARWRRRSNSFTWLLRRCDEATAQRVRGWRLPGVHSTSEFSRLYPCVIPRVGDPLGFVGDSLKGLSGLERYYNDILKGKNGEGMFLADAKGRRFSLDPMPVKPTQPGARLQLTLDWGEQSILADELVAAVDKWHARSGMALLMNPYTGAIRAMVDYDPAGPGRKSLRCRLVADMIEPGSTFKLVTFAAALSDGVLTLDRYFDGERGAATFSGRTLHDDTPHGIMSAAEVFVVSSNIGTGRIANLLPAGRLEYWARRLGFGRPTGIDLDDESPGRITWQWPSEFNTATLAIGHGVAVTPIQLAVAYAAVANGGYLVRPHLVQAIERPGGRMTPVPFRAQRVLKPEVAVLMTRLMRNVVRTGTAKRIWDPQFPIGGKTGTAEKPNRRTGRYDKNRYIASFVGFYPADRPRLLGLVILDEPQKVHYGGYTAAPVLLNTVRRLAIGTSRKRPPTRSAAAGSDIACLQGLGRGWTRRLVDAVAPMVSIIDEAHAGERIDAAADANGDQPKSVAKCETGWERWLSRSRTNGPLPGAAMDVWPDYRGMNLRDALAVLRAMKAKAETVGSGLVIGQFPAAGSPVGESRICRLVLK